MSEINQYQDSMSNNANPRVLLTDTDRRPYAARIAIALAGLGCEVYIVCTPGHPARKTAKVRKCFSYSPVHPLDSVSGAIRRIAPDIVIPCDDRAVAHLHQLYWHTCRQGGSGDPVCNVIDRSLGAPSSFEIVSSRFDLLRIAEEEGLRVPKTRKIEGTDDILGLASERDFPWVLKSDGTWGGRGVRVAKSVGQALKMFPEIKRPYGFNRALKRFCINRDAFWLRPWWEEISPAVVAQSFVTGEPANCAVLCREGQVVAGIAVEVISAEGETGPASVVRVVEGPEMMHCASALARRLKLSGFFGLDFIIEHGTGAAYLIEMNPRLTPVCHLRLGNGRDMVGELAGKIGNRHSQPAPSVTDKELIAYFPQAWIANSKYLEMSYHDLPVGEPELARELMNSWPERTFVYRMFDCFYKAAAKVMRAIKGAPQEKDAAPKTESDLVATESARK